MELPLDAYTLKARLAPALLTLLPIVITSVALFPQSLDGWHSLYVLASASGLLYLLSELSRRAGKQMQEKLFKAWGGKPSVALLRFRGARNRELVVDRHRTLRALFPDRDLPSEKAEERDPQKADDLYEVIGQALIEKTRDRKQFSLLFKENCSYGFWRNMWGLKPVGIIICLLSLALIAAVAVLRPGYFLSLGTRAVFFPLVFDVAFISVWIFWIKPSAVRIPAESYAERLLEAGTTLARMEQMKP